MRFRLGLALLPLALAACDEQSMQDFRMPWDRPLDATPAQAAAPADPSQIPLVDPDVSPMQVPIEVEGQRSAVATAESTTLNTTAFMARGNEPFWRIDVSGSSARYATPDNQSGRDIAVNRIVYQQGVEYVGTLNGAPFSLNIRNVACQDSMSGERFPMTANLRVGSQRMGGCAQPGQPAEAQAPAARPQQG